MFRSAFLAATTLGKRWSLFIAPLRKIRVIFLVPNCLQRKFATVGSELETAQSPMALAFIWDSGAYVESEGKHKRVQWCAGFMKWWRYQSDGKKGYITSAQTFSQTAGPGFNFWVNSLKFKLVTIAALGCCFLNGILHIFIWNTLPAGWIQIVLFPKIGEVPASSVHKSALDGAYWKGDTFERCMVSSSAVTKHKSNHKFSSW